jgi:hypothetical protein
MAIAARDLVARQSASMIATLDSVKPDLLAALFADAFTALGSQSDLAVRLMPEAETGPQSTAPACSVAGVYFADEHPPVLAVAAAASAGRRAFTALHEFGHHLQRTQTPLMDLLLQQPDGGILLEEAACDAFAAEILLPRDLVDRFIGNRGPSGPNVVDLWHASDASRAAVCVRAAQRLPAPGQVVLLNSDGTVSFAASMGLPPVKRASQQGDIGTVRDAFRRSGRATGRTRLRYRDGILGEELHAQVVPMDGYLLLVAVTDSAPWETFSLPSVRTGPVATAWVCEHPDCGHEFRSFDPHCSRCHRPTCPDCGRCGCEPRVRERTCAGCFQRLPASLFAGSSDLCRDCA